MEKCSYYVLMDMYIGVNRKVNVGISNDKVGEKFVYCKIKVFWLMLIGLGLVGI